MARRFPYSAELRRRAVAMVADVRSEYDTEFAAITSVARQLGIGSAETLRKWVRQAEVDAGKRSSGSSIHTGIGSVWSRSALPWVFHPARIMPRNAARRSRRIAGCVMKS